MKGRILLLSSISMLFAMGAMAQDYAPANWKFSKMEKGSAEGIFIREMASSKWNCSAPFRLGDNLDGSVGLACAVGGDVAGPASDKYEGMTDDDKAVFEEFYKACQIVDGGVLGNIFCYQGNTSTGTDSRAVKNTKSMPNSTLFWLSNTDIPLGNNYRLSVSFRVIADAAEKMKLTLATSSYDGIDQGTGLANDGYREFELPVYTEFNDYWSTAKMDITIKDNTDPNYKELPLVMKMWLGNGIESGIVLFRDFKLEKIDAIDNEYVPGKIVDEDWDDTPTGISYTEKDNQAVVWAKDGQITVVDAASPVSVYSISGQLVAFKAPMSNVTTIPVSEKGVYVVKVGNSCRKVVL